MKILDEFEAKIREALTGFYRDSFGAEVLSVEVRVSRNTYLNLLQEYRETVHNDDGSYTTPLACRNEFHLNGPHGRITIKNADLWEDVP